MDDAVHHHVGAVRRLRQCLEQGCQSRLWPVSDRDLGAGALHHMRCLPAPRGWKCIHRALQRGGTYVQRQEPPAGHRCPDLAIAVTSRSENNPAAAKANMPRKGKWPQHLRTVGMQAQERPAHVQAQGDQRRRQAVAHARECRLREAQAVVVDGDYRAPVTELCLS
jgi:hypothetical protein